ncbi:MAG: Flagellar biosynthetic protein fliR [uncultured bacterium]|nr:MAG: Flagellar biosynthetic protein fliR [uncultured bacterium]HBH17797.1 flagellar biosynthetic protein FliR [Cyanobacteria bacterium UBA9579]
MDHDISILFSMKSMIVFILVISRISGMLATAPLFSTFPIPMQVKAGLAAMTAFIIYPIVLSTSTFPVPHDLLTLMLMVSRELFIGILLGFCAQLIFVGIQIGGQLLSMQMGLAISQTLDPVTRQQVPIIGQFYLYIASLAFIFLNGPQWLFSTIFATYKTIPMGLSFEFTADMTQKILLFTSQIFSIAFGIVMPLFAILFLIDIALGFTSKLMPQMNIFMVSIPLKIILGLIIMNLFMPTTAVYLSSLIERLLGSIGDIFI